jgi:hypothetical protein
VFKRLLRYVDSLGHGEQPNYNFLADQMKRCLESKEDKLDWAMDWSDVCPIWKDSLKANRELFD